MKISKTTDNVLIEIGDEKKERLKNKLKRQLKSNSKESDKDRGSQRMFNTCIQESLYENQTKVTKYTLNKRVF